MKKGCDDLEVKTITHENIIARVYIPELSVDERNRRMKQIHNAAVNILKDVEQKTNTY